MYLSDLKLLFKTGIYDDVVVQCAHDLTQSGLMLGFKQGKKIDYVTVHSDDSIKCYANFNTLNNDFKKITGNYIKQLTINNA